MNVLSLFDGMSCGQIALTNLGIEVDNYFASEIDKYAIEVSSYNYPNTIHVGDVRNITVSNGMLVTDNGIFKIDLLIGGSPCQSLSRLGNGTGLAGKSGLFYEYLRIKNELHPCKFLLENVVCSNKDRDVITAEMGVSPIKINSNMYTPQSRNRYYWTNIPFELDNKTVSSLKDILEDGVPVESIISESRLRWLSSEKGKLCVEKGYASIDPEIAQCLTARSEGSWNSNYVTRDGLITRLTPKEYERLQGVPDDYTSVVKIGERYKMIGNGWTVNVIENILSGIAKEKE